MPGTLIESVPNFSEGTDSTTIDAIVTAIRAVEGAHVLAWESDRDHNRTVVTVVGRPKPVLEAVFRGVACAVERIDLRRHQGVHPRIGAADVVPLIPIEGASLEDCAALAHQLGDRIASELAVPVYFYETAALRPDRRRLENVRRGGFEQLREAAQTDPDRAPDRGPRQLHPSAGAVAVGARKYLLAFNINLQTADVEVAQAIARKVRASSGGLPHVKAMGVFLASRNLAQVSMNLTDFEVTPLHVVFEAVRTEAARMGVAIAGSEIIGLMPARALAHCAGHYLQCETNPGAAVLESRLLPDLLD